MSSFTYSHISLSDILREHLELKRTRALMKKRRKREEEEKLRLLRRAEVLRREKALHVKSILEKLGRNLKKARAGRVDSSRLRHVESSFEIAKRLYRHGAMENLFLADSHARTIEGEMEKLEAGIEEERKRRIFEKSMGDSKKAGEMERVKILEARKKRQLNTALDEAIGSLPEPCGLSGGKCTRGEIAAIHEMIDNMDPTIVQGIQGPATPLTNQLREVESLDDIENEYYFRIVSVIRKNLGLIIKDVQRQHAHDERRRGNIRQSILRRLSDLGLVVDSPLNNIDLLKNEAGQYRKELDSLFYEPDIRRLSSGSQPVFENVDRLVEQFQTVARQETERAHIVETIGKILEDMGYDAMEPPYQQDSAYKAPVFSRFYTPNGAGMQVAVSADGTTFIQMKRLVSGDGEDQEWFSSSETKQLQRVEKKFCDGYSEMIHQLEKSGMIVRDDGRRYFQNPAKIPVIHVPGPVRERRKRSSRKMVRNKPKAMKTTE